MNDNATRSGNKCTYGALLNSEDFDVNGDGKPTSFTKEDLNTIDSVPIESIVSYN